ncbi:MAG: porin [Armatimonadota bacterium]
MKRTLIIVLMAALTLGGVNYTFAAVDPVDILIKALVDKQIITEDEASSVRSEIAAIKQDDEAARKSYNVTGKRPVKLSGYVQTRYSSSPQEGTFDSLEARRVRLSLGGDVTPNADFKVQVDFAGSRKGLKSAKLGNDGSLSTSSANFAKPLLLDAVFGYKLPKNNKLSIGQFKIPFGLENLTSSTNLDTINRSQVTETLVPGRDTGNQGRDVGIQINGNRELNEDGSKQIEYALGVFNGGGINTADDNSRKDIAARAVWKPGIDGLSVGLAAYNGALGADHSAHTRTGTELVYNLNPWAFKSEYIWGKDGSVKKKGWYATAVRQITDTTQAVVRYDVLNPNTSSVDDNSTNSLTLGFNKFLNKDGYSRWQLNYEIKNEKGPAISNNLLTAQFQAGF